jgi:hypothetical protein
MNPTDIYRQAIKRTFADLYGVEPHEVDVSWSRDGDNITVRFADKTFTHETIHVDDAPQQAARARGQGQVNPVA